MKYAIRKQRAAHAKEGQNMLKCAAVFSDNMVLQLGKDINTFGEATPGNTVSVAITRRGEAAEQVIIASACGQTSEDGKWLVALPAVEYYEDNLELAVRSGEEEICFKNVAVGEVFLAGGQSNMEREMGTALDGQKVLDLVKGSGDKASSECAQNVAEETDRGITDGYDMDVIKRVRFYYTQKRAYFDEHFFEDEAAGGWQLCGSEWMKAWSAVGFFFAYKIAAEIGCTVGILGCNWGGTSAACWMGRDDLLQRESTRIYADEYDNSPDIAGKSVAQQIADVKEYEEYQREWDRKSGELYASVPGITWDEVQERIGKCRYPGPLNCASFVRPYGLYETMLKRVAPYTVKGFLYYQGESDDHRPDTYYDMMQALVPCWRREFGDRDALFILTQLPMHKYKDDPDYRHWAVIREAQRKASETIPGVAMAVIIDQGEFNEIHPLYKRRVGERLALQALWKAYGRITGSEACGPVAAGATVLEDGSVEIEFKNCEQLQVIKRLYGTQKFDGKKETDLPGFELAGADGEFCKAEATLTGECKNRIRLVSEKVKKPVSVRYQWTNYGDVTLYGETKKCIGEPLPVAPFRLDIV